MKNWVSRCLHSVTAGRGSSRLLRSWVRWRSRFRETLSLSCLQLIFLCVFPSFSALAAAGKACVSVWCTAPRLIAATPRWGQTAPRPALWSPAPGGRPRTGMRSVTHRVMLFPQGSHSFCLCHNNKIQIKPSSCAYAWLFQCSVTCGGGFQQRKVNCVAGQDLAVMPNSLCEKISRPEMLRKCNMQECKTKTGTGEGDSSSASLDKTWRAYCLLAAKITRKLKLSISAGSRCEKHFYCQVGWTLTRCLLYRSC